MGWIPARITQPRPERRMLERPPTVDEVAGIERFRCLDLTCVLTRRACADRWRNATKLRRVGAEGLVAESKPGRAEAVHAASTCRGCPVGEIHAREERALPPRVRLRVVRAEPPPPTTPPQVQPAPAPSPAAGLQPRLDLRDAARAGAETSPAEAPPAFPPGPATSAGLRPTDDDCSDDQEGQQQEEDTMATTTKTTKRAEPTTTATRPAPARGQGGTGRGGPPRTLTHQGKTQTIRAWADELGLTDAAIRMRLLKGLPVERVLGPRLEGGPPRSSKAEKAARPPQRPQRRASKASTPKRPAPAPRPPDGRVEAPTTLVVPAAPRHPAVELLEAVGYHVRQLAAPAGVVLLVQEATG